MSILTPNLHFCGVWVQPMLPLQAEAPVEAEAGTGSEIEERSFEAETQTTQEENAENAEEEVGNSLGT